MSAYNELQLSSYVDQIFTRLQRIEAQVALLSQQAGLPWEDPAAEAPSEVVELARSGDRMKATMRYRELTGADLEQARAVVEQL